MARSAEEIFGRRFHKFYGAWLVSFYGGPHDGAELWMSNIPEWIALGDDFYHVEMTEWEDFEAHYTP